MSSFHFFTVGINSKSLTWPVHSIQETRFEPNTVLWVFNIIQPSSSLLLRPRSVRSFAISVRVCLSVCPLTYLKNDMSQYHKIFCTCYLWPWLGPPLTTVQKVTHFLFCGLPADLSPLECECTRPPQVLRSIVLFGDVIIVTVAANCASGSKSNVYTACCSPMHTLYCCMSFYQLI